MNISQARVSEGLNKSLKERFLVKYQLLDYVSEYKPAFFFGCYSMKDFKAIMNHKSAAIIIWGGSDSMRLPVNLAMDIAAKRNVYSIAISNFVKNDLYRHGFRYKMLPINVVDPAMFEPAPLGENVFCYLSFKKKNYTLYGLDVLEKVKLAVGNKFSFIIKTFDLPENVIEYHNMPEIYKKCFIGLRFTRHDGLSNTAVELGLMGRRCIWNGQTPNAIPYNEKNIQPIVEMIERDSKMIGKTNDALATKMREYLTIPDDWKHTRYYGDLVV